MIVLFFIFLSIYFLFNLSVFKNILFSMDWLSILFFMFLYALITCVPAVICRLKFETYVRKWLPFAATVLSVICLITIAADTKMATIGGNEWIFDFAQYILVSSVPVLYCVAFWGTERDMWIAFVPSLMYFSSFFLRYGIVYGFAGVFEFIRYFDLQFILNQNPDPLMLRAVLTAIWMSVVFAVWALLCILISRIIYRLSLSNYFWR